MEILVGNKPVKNYVLYVLATLPKEDKVLIKARGRSIAKAVDVAEILKRKGELLQGSITIGTDVLKDKETQKDIRVSTIELVLTKAVSK